MTVEQQKMNQRVIICPRCEGSGAIWCWDHDGQSIPQSEFGSCGAWRGRWQDYSWSTSDHTCPCDVCGGTGRIAVEPAPSDTPLSEPVPVVRGDVSVWRLPPGVTWMEDGVK